MKLNIYCGMISVAIFLGMVFCLKIPGKLYYRFILSFSVVLGSMVPVFSEKTSLIGYVYAFTDILSISLVFWLGSQYFRKNYPIQNEKWLILVTGILLYASTLGYLPMVWIYSSGYSGLSSLFICLFLFGLVSKISRIVIVFSYILFMAGIYINLFDALIDPILWLICFFDQLCSWSNLIWHRYTKKNVV